MVEHGQTPGSRWTRCGRCKKPTSATVQCGCGYRGCAAQRNVSARKKFGQTLQRLLHRAYEFYSQTGSQTGESSGEFHNKINPPTYANLTKQNNKKQKTRNQRRYLWMKRDSYAHGF
ncbi:hypothetical protein ATANTOWER_025911 [Ataeniobius toweri]|uniref:Uncharacterized protein n=1 Tax=Ataeniobius toweri TaxID=208326 RepID=A0ABU7BBC2_9TELE|nr:hypothetical protein [Ataeniobius toweri]